MESKKNTKSKNVVDVSTFFIFEATGDSEADQFVDPNKGASTVDRRGNDVGDAESCSQDDDDDADRDDEGNFPFVNKVNGMKHRNDNVQVCINDDKEEEGEEAHSYYPAWPQHHHHHQNKNGNKKPGAVDSSSHEEFTSEMEKNKQFWDSCLAS